MSTIIQYQGRKITAQDWPGKAQQGSTFLRDIAGACSIGYGRCSSNPKASQGIQDSADAQAARYADFCRYWGTHDLGVFLDPNSSAGISAAKERENFAAAMAKIRDDKRVQILWVMTSSRFSRGDMPFDDLIIPLIEHGVLFAVGNTLYNPANRQDRNDMFAKYASDSTATEAGLVGSEGGKERALAEGRAVCRAPYGLFRDRNQIPVMDIPDIARPCTQDAPDVPAEVVAEIIRRVAAGDTVTGIALDLERRRVLTPRAARGHKLAGVGAGRDESGGPDRIYQWQGQTVRGIATNPVYIGLRRSKGKILEGVKANVVPLVSEADFNAAQRALDGHGKPRGVYSPRNMMLSSAAFCGVCEMPLGSVGRAPSSGGQPTSRARRARRLYGCRIRGHASIREDWLDEYVSLAITDWLSSPAVMRELADRHEDVAAEAEAAEAEAMRLQDRIEAMRQQMADPPPGFDDLEANLQIGALKRQREAALARSCPPMLDPLLAGALGDDAGVKWAGYSPAVRRRLVTMIAKVTLMPVPDGQPKRWGSSPATLPRRVRLKWKMHNPATGQLVTGGLEQSDPGPLPPYVPADVRRAGAVAAWLASQDGPRTVNQIAAGTGEHVVSLWRALDVLLDDGRAARQRDRQAWRYRAADGTGPVPDLTAAQQRAGRVAAWLGAQDGPRSTMEIAAAFGVSRWAVNEALKPLLEAGRITRELGASAGGGHGWVYQLAG